MDRTVQTSYFLLLFMAAPSRFQVVADPCEDIL